MVRGTRRRAVRTRAGIGRFWTDPDGCPVPNSPRMGHFGALRGTSGHRPAPDRRHGGSITSIPRGRDRPATWELSVRGIGPPSGEARGNLGRSGASRSSALGVVETLTRDLNDADRRPGGGLRPAPLLLQLMTYDESARRQRQLPSPRVAGGGRVARLAVPRRPGLPPAVGGIRREGPHRLRPPARPARPGRWCRAATATAGCPSRWATCRPGGSCRCSAGSSAGRSSRCWPRRPTSPPPSTPPTSSAPARPRPSSRSSTPAASPRTWSGSALGTAPAARRQGRPARRRRPGPGRQAGQPGAVRGGAGAGVGRAPAAVRGRAWSCASASTACCTTPSACPSGCRRRSSAG